MRSSPTLIEGELVATAEPSAERFAEGEIVQHDKFGPGVVVHVEGNKLTIDFLTVFCCYSNSRICIVRMNLIKLYSIVHVQSMVFLEMLHDKSRIRFW